jgi:hypothetical protein
VRFQVGMALVLLGLIVAGCGGGGDSETTASQLSKAEFIKEGEKICKAVQVDRRSELKEVTKDLNPGEVLPVSRQEELLADIVLPKLQSAADQLDELASRTNDPKAAAYVAELEAGIEASEKNPTKALKANPFIAVGETAKAYGFEECATL